MRPRILVILAALAFSVPLFAQSNAIAVFANRTTFDSTKASDPDVTLEIKFDPKTGYGVSYDRFFSPSVSAQFLAQRVRGTTKLAVSAPGTSLSQSVGPLDLDEFDAALHWHFGSPSSAIRPYAGVGIASIQNAKVTIEPDFSESGTTETENLDNKVTWIADAGVDFRISPNAAIIVTAKYTHYSSSIVSTPDDPIQRLKINPLTFAAGVSWRF